MSAESAGGPVRVTIAEDAVVLRDGLVQLLTDRGFSIVAAVADAAALRSAVGALTFPFRCGYVPIRQSRC